MVAPYLDLVGSSSSMSVSIFPENALYLLAIKVGTTIHIMEGKRTCSINWAADTLLAIQSMVVVTSPMGDQAPPALAAIIIIPANQSLVSLSLITF